MRPWPGTGVDALPPADIGRQPDIALAELAQHHSAIEESLDAELVGLLAMVARIWSLARGPLKSWAEESEPKMDAA
eukprot:3435040-Pyramimonas_sp.AAC.1